MQGGLCLEPPSNSTPRSVNPRRVHAQPVHRHSQQHHSQPPGHLSVVKGWTKCGMSVPWNITQPHKGVMR